MNNYHRTAAKIAIALHECMMDAAAAEDWDRFKALSDHIADRSPNELLSLAKGILNDGGED